MDFFHVVAFSDKAFEGNPAAVVLTRGDLPLSTYSKIASEFNLSETAFVDVSAVAGFRVNGSSEEALPSFPVRQSAHT
jgi:predicted PhzF superfamily epimerase YddE/YHI9